MKIIKKLTFLLVISFSQFFTAQIKLPSLVGNNMVLQQNSEVNLWGWASPNENIKIQLEWQKIPITITADVKGNWKVIVKTPEGSKKSYSITLEGKNKIKLTNVLIGEVWVCSGQSNMFFPVGKEEGTWKTGVKNYEEEVKNANYPDIRLFTVVTVASQNPLEDVQGSWNSCSPETITNFSAVAYFFGREIYQKLNVPIGLISSSWGGTKAEAWTSQKVLEGTPDFLSILESNVQREKKYYTSLEEYYTNLKKEQVEHKESTFKSELKKPKPQGENKVPYVLYNGMLHPLINYTIKGVIWYQGESNAEAPYLYRSLFPAMVQNWRDDWGQGDFPFYYVQITPHKGQNPEIREAQLMSLKKIANSGMVVTTDVGDAKNIHPIDKQTVGHRLALIAKAKTYNETKLVYSGPIYKNKKIKNDKIQLFFDFAESGFKKVKGNLKEFEIAATDKVFYPAQAKIDGKTIVVFSSKVKNPIAVRFAWKPIPEPNLFNNENLPASPFRTDDWRDKTINK